MPQVNVQSLQPIEGSGIHGAAAVRTPCGIIDGERMEIVPLIYPVEPDHMSSGILI